MSHDAMTQVLVATIVLVAIPYLIHSIPAVRRNIPILVLFIFGAVGVSPSVLGKVNPELQAYIAGPSNAVWFTMIGTFGIMIFLFKVGAHISFDSHGGEHGTVSKGDNKIFAITTVTSTFLPMAIGMSVAYFLVSLKPSFFMGAQNSHILVAAAMGLSVTVSALSVMSTIYIERGIIHSPRAALGLKIATGHEIFVWTVVALIFSALPHHEGGHSQSVLQTLILAVLFVTVMFALKATLFQYISDSKTWQNLSENKRLAFIVVIGFAASLATHLCGVHYAFGCVVAGAALPQKEKELLENATGLIGQTLLINIYYIGALMTLNVDFSTSFIFIVSGVLLVTAYVGQFFGATLPMVAMGKSWKESLIMACDLTDKGVVETVVMSSFLAVSLVTPELFASIMLMAGCATALNVPLTTLIERIFAARETHMLLEQRRFNVGPGVAIAGFAAPTGTMISESNPNDVNIDEKQ